MYSSDTGDYQKPSAPPPQYGQPAAGIPVSSGSQFHGVQFQQHEHRPINQAQPGSPSSWSTGLCGCCDNVSNCCITCWCPCITFGQIAEILDKGATSCGASGALYALIYCVTRCSCLYSCFYRSKMRRQYMLPKAPCGDCLVHCCCETCALCQEYRELNNRGFDMTIGWQGNVERQTRGVAMAPVVHGGMTR